MRRFLVMFVVLMLAPGVAYAGGGGVDTSGCAGYSEGASLSMRDSCFAGTAHFAPTDTTITVSNDGGLPHTLTAVDGSFDTGQVAAGESAQLTFDEPGVYRVFCTLHGTAEGEGMAGVVVVGEAEPASMAAPLDIAPFEAKVSEESEMIRQAMENQGRTMGEIKTVQADMADTLAALQSGDGPSQAEVIAVPGDVSAERLVLMVMVGLAAGLALAALLTVLRFRMAGGEPTKGIDRFEPSAES